MTKKNKQEKEAKAKKEEAMKSEVEELSAEEKELEELRTQLIELEAHASENLNGWQRTQAEFANYKKRMARDQEAMHQDLRGKIIKRYLEVVDDLERALNNAPKDEEGAEWAKGIELVYRKMITFLEADGVQAMQVIGEFDPNMHEAIAQEESDEHESGQIIEVLQTGYYIGDRVLRPAVVKVAQ